MLTLKRVRPSKNFVLLLLFVISVVIILLIQFNDRTPQNSRKCSLQREEIVRNAQRVLPQLPIRFWEGNEYWNWYYKNFSCARFPSIGDLQIYDHYWQSLHTQNYKFHLYGAYYDAREQCSTRPTVRILGMIDSNFQPSYKLYCQIWFLKRTEPVIIENSEYFNILPCYWEKEYCDMLYTYLITCPIPREFSNQKPIYVSLVKKKCDVATNILTINDNMLNKNEQKEQFAICVKMLDFLHEDWSERTVEWIEMMRILGANKIFFYTLNVNDNMNKVFKYYKRLGIAEVVPITLGGYQPNTAGLQHLYMYSNRRNYYQRTLHELVSLNDCFYKNMYKYHFISALDLDEVIVPLKDYNWTDLMNKEEKKSKSSSDERPAACYAAKPTIFSTICDHSTKWNEDIPNYMHILRHVLHYDYYLKINDDKVFFNTEVVEAVHNHQPMKCLTQGCYRYNISVENARVFHYRNEDFEPKALCSQIKLKMKKNTSIWRYNEVLINRTFTALTALNLFW